MVKDVFDFRENKEVKKLIKDERNLTTSDLQGVVIALADKYGFDEDEVLGYIYEQIVLESI
jgi:hypothetical protein